MPKDPLEGPIRRLSSFLAYLTLLLGGVLALMFWVFFAVMVVQVSGPLGGFLLLCTIAVAIGGWFLSAFLHFDLQERYRKWLERNRGGPPWYRHPNDISGYPEGVQERVMAVKARLEKRFAQEDEDLAALGIPVPAGAPVTFEIVADENFMKEYRYQWSKVFVRFPTYRIPRSFFYKLFDSGILEHDRGAGYCVAGDEETVAAAEKDFTARPEHAIENYSGVWINRAPYELYEKVSDQTLDLTFFVLEGDTFDRLFHDSDIIRLVKVEPFTGEQVERILMRQRLFGALVENTGLPATGPPVPVWLSSEIPFRLPVPQGAPKVETLVLKLLLGKAGGLSATSRLWDSLRALKKGFCFDLVAGKDGVYITIAIVPHDQEFFETQLRVHLPDCTIAPAPDVLKDEESLHIATLLPNHTYGFLKPARHLTPDPYSSFLAYVDEQPSEKLVCFRVTALPLPDETIQMVTEEIERLGEEKFLLHLQNWLGWISYLSEKLLPQAKDLQSQLRQRASEIEKKMPAWIAAAQVYATDRSLLDAFKRHCLAHYETPDQKLKLSEITQAEQDGKFCHWTVWNTEELAAVAHLPDSGVVCERLERTTSTMKAPPALMTGQGSAIGVNDFRGQKSTIAIPDSVRDRHLYIIGKTRTGKSTLMLNLAVQDIRAGKGIGVIDPHGDLIEDLLRYIPKERVEDTVHWDASERTRPIGLNIMEVHTDEEVGLVADDLLVTFRRLSDTWGDRMESLLRYIFHTLLHCEGTTFFDVQNILVNEKRRQELVSQLEDPMLMQFWTDQLRMYGKDARQPILSRMSKFVLTPAVNAALGQRNSSLNFFEVLQNQKILLVNLASGKIGEDSAKLLGSLVVSQIQLAAMRRAKVRREARAPFHLYVDEFQNFTTSSFDKILSEAGKYKLCLALAHQYISQLDDKIRNAILGNAGTLMMFPSSAQDAQCLRAELGTYTIEDLTDLSAQEHEALCRPPTKSSDTFKLRTLPPPERPTTNYAHEVIEHSRVTYGRRPEAQSVQPREPKPQPGPAAAPSVVPQQPPAAKVTAPAEPTPQKPLTQSPPVVGTKPATLAETPRVKDVPLVLGPTSQGRGGMAHKQLQYLIRNFGQKFGYQATIEKQILGGAGSVDVALEKGELAIACQVCVTTGAEYEVQSIRKCVEAGFSAIVLISDSRKTLNKARDLLANAVPPVAENRVRFLALEDLAAFLVELEAAGASKVETIRGRKVSVTYKALSPEEQDLRKQAINEVVAGSLLRLGRMQPE